MGQIQSLEEFIDLVSRRRWLIVCVAVFGILASVIFAKSRHDLYESTAAIQVETAAVQGNDAQRNTAAGATLQLIEQRLTTRENLAAMIERHGLYADLALSADKKIDLLRLAVRFEGIGSAGGQNFGGGSGVSAILVHARLDDPQLAARVANDLAQSILDQSASVQRSRTDQNVVFFQQEVDRIGQQIAEIESETAAYKNRNPAALPESRDAKRDEMISLEADLRRQQQDQLALQGEADQINAKDTRRETDRRALETITSRLLVLDAQIADGLSRRAELRADLAASPEVERVLAGYDRRIEQLRDQHDTATARMVQAETDARLAEQQQAERLTLLERAIIPEEAIGGSNRKLVVAGTLASLIAGLALAFGLDLMFPVVRSAAQMERQLGLRPVVSIPEAKLQQNPRPEKRAGKGVMKLLDDPTKPLLGLPRYVVLSGALTLALLTAATMV